MGIKKKVRVKKSGGKNKMGVKKSVKKKWGKKIGGKSGKNNNSF